jgi:TATA-box binding protein (TBP) (component of TFIID and TFIIIB)
MIKNNTYDDTKHTFKNHLGKILNIFYLPDDVGISTMTLVCTIDTFFNVCNIGEYMPLNKNNILSIKYGNKNYTNRTINITKKRNKKKKTKRAFFNQVSIEMFVDEYITQKNSQKKMPKIINIKLFKNGSIQMTGCTTVHNCYIALFKLLKCLSLVRYKPNSNNTKIVEICFTQNNKLLDLQNIKNIKIAMINSNFNIDMLIDRDRLYNLLINNKYDCTYDPINHACINLKYHYIDTLNNEKNKIISIFIFESGAIIITGANNCLHINNAYIFINNILLDNYHKIYKRDFSSTFLEILHNSDDNYGFQDTCESVELYDTYKNVIREPPREIDYIRL